MSAENINDLPLAGGHVALDLVNTVEPRFETVGQREHLTTPAALLTWSRRSGVLDEAAAARVEAAWLARPAAASEDLSAVIELREAVYAALHALLQSQPPDLTAVTGHWTVAASRAALTQTAAGVALEPAASIPDRLAFAAVDLLTGLDLTRLRACPPDEGGCGWLFLDHSRNNTRRWCVMADCGNQAKSRKLTARRRSDRAAARSTG